MSKARPLAHIYEKWVRGIKQAVPNEQERCGLYEYIIEYQFAKVYGVGNTPSRSNLSVAAQTACAMLEGDLDELCDARRENNKKRAQNGAQNIPSSTEQVQAGASRPIQNNTIQNNTTQSQNNTIQDTADLVGQMGFIKEFDLGLALLRNGYIVKATDLHNKYERARQAKNPVAYAKAGLREAHDKAGLAAAVNYLEATGCKDTRGLELFGAKIKTDEGERVLEISCTTAARDAIGKIGQDKASEYLKTIGVKNVIFWCNGQ